MAVTVKPGWSRPSTILFASEIPANERALAFAEAQAVDSGADLILFHAYDTLVVSASENTGIRYYDYAAAERLEKKHLEPLAERIRQRGILCDVVVRPGLAADQILGYLREHEVHRIVMGTHSPGPIGKLLVGSVAEAVLRTSPVPVCIVGPQAVDGAYRQYATRTVICALRMLEYSPAVALFAAETAAVHNARLILQHVIKPQERQESLARHSAEEIEKEMLAMIPEPLQAKLSIQTIVVQGDPTEELLYQSRAQQVDLMVLGAQGASAFAAATRQGVVYKLLAQAPCPVLTLSPTVLDNCCANVVKNMQASSETYIAGVI
jgi:nucleotide-binding universal stress UspA family protein